MDSRITVELATLALAAIGCQGPSTARPGKQMVGPGASNAPAAIMSQPLSHSAPQEKADRTFNIPGMPLQAFLGVYEDLAGKHVKMMATPNPSTMLRVETDRPLTKSQALQLLEHALKEQAGLIIVHESDGSVTAVGKVPGGAN